MVNPVEPEESVTHDGQVGGKGGGESAPEISEGALDPSVPLSVVEPVPIDVQHPVTRQDLAVIQFFNRVDRLFSEQLAGRDREIAAKDRLIAELERRAEQAEEHAGLLKEYIVNLPPSTEHTPVAEKPPPEETGRAWWKFWR